MTTAPPAASTRHSRPARPNPIAPAVGRPERLDSRRPCHSALATTRRRGRAHAGPPDATTAIDLSGEIAAKLGSSAGNVNRTSRAGGPVSTPDRSGPIATPAASAAVIASPHSHQRRAVDDADRWLTPPARCVEPDVADVTQALLRIALETAPQQVHESRRRRTRQQAPVDLAGEHGGKRVGRVSQWKSGRPVSISHATTPNAQMSARLSTVRPRACSGAM